MSLIIPANTLASGGYEVANSLRFNSGSSDYLTRTPSSASNRRTCTVSLWVKQSILTGNRVFFDQEVNGSNFIRFYLDSNNRLAFYIEDSSAGGTQALLKPSALLRDVSAWYHFVIAVDVTQATESNRVKMYINGELQTSFNDSNYPSQNLDIEGLNTTNPVDIGRRTSNNDNLFNGYISEFCFIDGLALAADQFGEFDEDSGIWKPIDVSGLTFGTNGFYLDFEDSSALGNDAAGSNNWTANNLTAVDQSTDTPTNNFATWNPLASSSQVTLSEGNLKAVGQGTDDGNVFCNLVPKTGKWYAEFKITKANDGIPTVGIRQESSGFRLLNGTSGAVGYYNYEASVRPDGQRYTNNSTGSWGGSTFITGSIVGIALDCDNGASYISVNGTYMNSGDPTSGASKTGAFITWTEAQAEYGGQTFASRIYTTSSAVEANFGSPPYAISSGNTDGNGYGNFEYAPPSGYLSLCTANLSEVLG